MNNPVRTFIALELNADLHKTIAGIQNDLKKIDCDVKWVNPAIAHLTLKFLGDVAQKKMDAVKHTFENSLRNFQPFEIELTQLGAFPRIESPQILWVGLGGNTNMIVEMVGVLEEEFAKLGFAKEKRDFQPHLTLGRMKSRKNSAALTSILQNYSTPQGIRQSIDQVTLFKSTLTSHGPTYEPLSIVPLKAGSGSV